VDNQQQARILSRLYRSLPKVELHRHLEGSLRLKTLQEISQAHNIPVPGTSELRELVSISPADTLTFENFLSKFKTLRLFYRSPEAIFRITREAIEDAAADNVRYMELHFTPVALSRAERFPLGEVMDWVLQAGQAAAAQNQLQIRYIVSVNRQEGPTIAEEVALLAVDRMPRGIIGIGLAGNEADYDGLDFEGVFQEACQSGLHVTIHAAEWGPGQNVTDAIAVLGAERIGHGVRVLEDTQAVELARERGTTFEVCITSNHQSGVVATLKDHPLPRMLAAGLNVTINTDDPSISQITLGNEYRVAVEELGFTQAMLRQRVLAAAQASFLPKADKARLVQDINDEFPLAELL
jgi:adenosine deaminase